MFPCTIKMFIETFSVFLLVTFANGQDRQLESRLNPGCTECDLNKNPLIYSCAKGPEDTIHQFWDFTDHVPAIVYVVGTPDSGVDVLWKKDKPDKFKFTNSGAEYSFAVAFESLIEYNDLKDNGQYEPDIPRRDVKYWPLDQVEWKITDQVLTEKEALVTMRGEDRRKKGVIEMKLDILPFKDYAVDLPHLIHTANSTLIDVQLVNYTQHRSFNSSRFALRLVLVSADPPWGAWTKVLRKSLDDEHTPGVFEIIEIKSDREANGGFVQFRPVSYTEPARSVSSSTNAYITNFNKTELPGRSILRSFYRDYFDLKPPYNQTVDLVVQDAVVSFGLAGDGFYSRHNYTAWSLTLGYGSPPLEGFSQFVLVIICIGLGVPTLLAVSGVAYMLVRRWKQRNTSARFTNDE